MHFGKRIAYLRPKFRREENRHTPPRFPIIQRSLRNIAAKHFLKAHGLSAKLQRIAGILTKASPLILDRIRLPESLSSRQGDSMFSTPEFKNITRTGNAERRGKHAHIPRDQQIAAAFRKAAVVSVAMQDRAVCGTEVFRPLVFNMDQRPLTAAETEMLKPRQLQIILFAVRYPIRVQVTPSGKCASSTVTV